MSSWKKAGKANQKTHRERHQPESRKHLGLLEKKKDYKKRADDYHEKGETLKVLRKRALDKNPDEFYFHMVNSKIKDGVHHELEKGDEHTGEQLKLMQTQDIKYINMKRTIESRQINRLQILTKFGDSLKPGMGQRLSDLAVMQLPEVDVESELHMTEVADSTKNTHTFFIEEGEEKTFDLAKRLDTHPSLINRKSNRPRLSDLAVMQLPEVDVETIESMKKKKDKVYKEIAKRIQREKELSVIQRKMELKRHLRGRDAKLLKPKRVKKGSKVEAPVYKFQYQRKK